MTIRFAGGGLSLASFVFSTEETKAEASQETETTEVLETGSTKETAHESIEETDPENTEETSEAETEDEYCLKSIKMKLLREKRSNGILTKLQQAFMNALCYRQILQE